MPGLAPGMTGGERPGPIVSRIKLLSRQVLVAAVSIALWHVLTTVPIGGVIVLPPFFFSTPGDVAARVFKWFAEGTIWRHLWITLTESALAFLVGSVGGVLVGFWFARQPMVAAVLDPYVKMINALPRVVLAPIFTLWFGLGIWSKVALGFTLVFFIVFFNVYQGVREVSPTILANARMLGMNERQLLRHVYLPSATSWVFSSLHTSVGLAFVGAERTHDVRLPAKPLARRRRWRTANAGAARDFRACLAAG